MIKKIIFLLFIPYISFGKVLYEKDKAVSDQYIQVSSFGSGKLKESTEFNLKCLRLESNNLYSGGEILFSKPIDLKEVWTHKDLLLTFDFIQGGSGLFINKKDPILKGSRRRFELKVTLLQPNNQGGEICFPVEVGSTQVGFLLSTIKELSLSQPLIGLKLSTSSDECLFLTRIHFDQDTTPIKGNILSSVKEVSLGEEVKFNAEGFGGKTPIQFQWAVNPKSIFQIDGKGVEWSYRFVKSGTYYIRLIISDLFGLKKPYITSKKIIVNP